MIDFHAIESQAFKKISTQGFTFFHVSSQPQNEVVTKIFQNEL
jgi:hypothetical protein